MLDLFFTVAGILLPFASVWFLLGAGAKLIGYAPTITGGMKFVGQKISEWWGVGQPSPAAWYPVDESQLAELTAALKPFFDILILEYAYQSIDLLRICYYQRGCKTDARVVDAIFRKFLRDFFNLSAGYPIYTWVNLSEEQLFLFASFMREGQKWIEQQHNNKHSREIQKEKQKEKELEE